MAATLRRRVSRVFKDQKKEMPKDMLELIDYMERL